MFTPERMLEVNLFVLEEDLEPVTEALARLEVLHLEDVHPEAWTASAEWAEIATTRHSLAQRLKRLLNALELSAVLTPPKDQLWPEHDVQELEAQVAMLEARLADWQARQKVNEQEIVQLAIAVPQVEALLPLEAPVERLRELRHMHFTIGTIPTANLTRVAEALFQISYVLVPINSDKARTLVFAACSFEETAILERALESAFFEAITLPLEVQGQAKDALKTLEAGLESARKAKAELENEGLNLAAELGPQLKRLWRRASADAQLAEAMRHFARHGQVYLIAGWVPEAQVAKLSKVVHEAAKAQVVMESLPPNRLRQDVPTLLQTPRWLKPFEGLVAIFGLPAYNELNPTVFAALAFLLMYGMMFGDLGHGLLLALVGLWLMRKSRMVGWLIIAAGLSAACFGLLYGSALGKQIFTPLWLQPMHKLQTLLISAVIAGVVLINLGFILNLINALRVRDWAGFYLDKNGLLGLALYWTLLGGGLAVLRQHLPLGLWLAMFATLAVLLWLREALIQRFFGGEAQPWGDLLVTGFFELFESLLSYVSNSLSFVRLGAFAVAHEGLSRVVLQYSGGAVGWLVLLFGTLLIVGFEGLIVGIQTLRLEYYEFFGRFFKGTGQAFVPLTLKGGQDESMGVRI